MSKMNTPQTMMFTSQLLAFIQSRTFGMNFCARVWNSRKSSSGSAATRMVAPMNGNAEKNPDLLCTRFTATVSMMMMSEGIREITSMPVLSAFCESALWRAPSRFAAQVVLHGQGDQGSDEQILNDVARRSGI